MITINDLNEFIDSYSTYINNNKLNTLLYINNNPTVIYSKLTNINEKFCTDNNIPLFSMGFEDLVRLLCPDDILLIWIYPYQSYNLGDVLNDFKSYLISKGLTCDEHESHLIINNKRVAESGEYNLSPSYLIRYGIMRISMTTNDYYFNNVSNNSPRYEAIGLSELGVSKDEIINWIINWVNNVQNIS